MILRLILLVSVAVLGWLFFVQNTDATTVLGLNLGFAAWKFSAPQPVTLLLLGSFSLGLLIGVVRSAIRSSVRSQRADRLERELSMTPAATPDIPETEDAWD